MIRNIQKRETGHIETRVVFKDLREINNYKLFFSKFQQRSSDFDNQSSFGTFQPTDCFGNDADCFSRGRKCDTRCGNSSKYDCGI